VKSDCSPGGIEDSAQGNLKSKVGGAEDLERFKIGVDPQLPSSLGPKRRLGASHLVRRHKLLYFGRSSGRLLKNRGKNSRLSVFRVLRRGKDANQVVTDREGGLESRWNASSLRGLKGRGTS